MGMGRGRWWKGIYLISKSVVQNTCTYISSVSPASDHAWPRPVLWWPDPSRVLVHVHEWSGHQTIIRHALIHVHKEGLGIKPTACLLR